MTQDQRTEPEQAGKPVHTADDPAPPAPAASTSTPSTSTPSTPRPHPRSNLLGKNPAGVLGLADILAAAVLALLAALVAFALPVGSQMRALITLPVLLVAPGYLLLQAAVGSHRPGQRLLHALIACGVSPPLVALLALLTAALPGGFRSGTIIVTVTLACLGLGAVAILRRRRVATALPEAASAS